MLFERYEGNPIISPDISRRYESAFTYNPAAVVHKGRIHVIYRAEGKERISSMCLATSKDGYAFERYGKNPVIQPELPEEKQGCEDPRITKINGTFYMTYTAYDGKHPERSQNIHTALAVSRDLVNWERKGIIAKGIKAAAISPYKVDGKFVMFIGGNNIRLAWSDDLVHWDVEKKLLFDVREGMFDSRDVEAGPAPFEYRKRLILFFNTADKQNKFHPSLAILSMADPRKILYRADSPLMGPEMDYELKGNVSNVIFGSGMVEFKGTYHYYYGGADKYVCLATVRKEAMEQYIDSILASI